VEVLEIKTVVCFANSRKNQGRCFAGKEVQTRQWIRPVSGRPLGELRRYEMLDRGRREPELLDIVEIPLLNRAPHAYQQENYVLGAGRWRIVDRLDPTDLRRFLDDDEDGLWDIGDGIVLSDRISETAIGRVKSSLKLVRPEGPTLYVTQTATGSRQLRALFSYRERRYNLVITDPSFEAQNRDADLGRYELPDSTVFCLSIGEPFEGNCYKLVAGVMSIE
jgi:hypothetical protein